MKYRVRRRLTSFDVNIEVDDSISQAEIVDVTDKGARVRIEGDDMEPGAQVTIDLHGKGRSAKVVWCKKGEVGIAFDEFLPLDVLAAVNRTLHRPKIEKKKRFLMD